jgi:hypothetical protein
MLRFSDADMGFIQASATADNQTVSNWVQTIMAIAGHVSQKMLARYSTMQTTSPMPVPPLKRYWGCARTALPKAGLTLVRDGDGDGAALFDRENPNQARMAIRVAGIRIAPADRRSTRSLGPRSCALVLA